MFLVSPFYFIIIIFYLLYKEKHTHCHRACRNQKQLVGVGGLLPSYGPPGIKLKSSGLTSNTFAPLSYVVRHICLVYLFPLADLALHTLTELDQIHEYTSTLSKGCVTLLGEIYKKVSSRCATVQPDSAMVINKGNEFTGNTFSCTGDGLLTSA